MFSNVQQVSMNVSERNFFPHVTLLLLPTHFHFRRHFARLLSAATYCTATKLINCWQEGSTSTAIPPACASNITGRQNKTEAITFRAPLVLKDYLQKTKILFKDI
jgi:hypothetical protein